MSNYLEHIGGVLLACCKQKMPKEERAVLALLVKTWQYSKTTTKAESVQIFKTIIEARKQEEIGGKLCETKSSRKARKVVNTLRVKYGLPVISDAEGYWVPRTLKESEAYIASIEKLSRDQGLAWFEKYKAMAGPLKVDNIYFNNQILIYK